MALHCTMHGLGLLALWKACTLLPAERAMTNGMPRWVPVTNAPGLPRRSPRCPTHTQRLLKTRSTSSSWTCMLVYQDDGGVEDCSSAAGLYISLLVSFCNKVCGQHYRSDGSGTCSIGWPAHRQGSMVLVWA